MKTIIHSFRVHAAPSRVYRALTTEGGLSGWWTTAVSIDDGPPAVVHFTFHGDFHPRIEVTGSAEDRSVAWTCVGGHENWRDNTFSFTLDERDGETQVHFVQEYAQELSDEVYGVYNFNWGYYLNSLKRLCETGEGAPFEPPG